MGVAAYFSVEKAIRNTLLTASDLSGVRVYIEQDLVWAAESAPAVYIYLTRRDAPASEQRIAAGRRTDWILAMSLWCVEWHLESTEQAAEARDSLIERVEVALMGNRSLDDTCDRSWLEGGEFVSGMGNVGFLSAGEILLRAKVFATT